MQQHWVLNDMLLARIVDNYVTFLSQTLARTHLINTCPRFDGVLSGSANLPKRLKNVVLTSVGVSCSPLVPIYEMASSIFEVRPEALRSQEKISIDEVLRHSSMRDLVEAMAEKKVGELSHKSVTKINAYFDKRLGISLVASEDDLSAIEMLASQRNLVVHNRGKVNRLYKRKVPSSQEEVGADLPVSYEHVVAAAQVLSRSVRHIEEQIIEKFPALSVGDGSQ